MPANPVPVEPPEVGVLKEMLAREERDLGEAYSALDPHDPVGRVTALRYALRVIEGVEWLKGNIGIGLTVPVDLGTVLYRTAVGEVYRQVREALAALLRPAATEGGETDG
jgi:hypothetical protein